MLTGAGPLSVCSARKQTDERRPKEHKRQSWSPFQKTRPRCTSDQPCSFVSSAASLFVCSEVEERKEFIVRRQRFSATRRSLPVSAEMFLPGTGKTGNLRHHHDGKDKEGLLVREALKKTVFLGIIPKPVDPPIDTSSNKVNRCLARYSPCATTTKRPTNRTPNKPALPGQN